MVPGTEQRLLHSKLNKIPAIKFVIQRQGDVIISVVFHWTSYVSEDIQRNIRCMLEKNKQTKRKTSSVVGEGEVGKG